MEKTGFEAFIAKRPAKISFFVLQICFVGILLFGNLDIYQIRHFTIRDAPIPVRIGTLIAIVLFALVFVFLLLKEKLKLIPFLVILLLQVVTIVGVYLCPDFTGENRYRYDPYVYRSYSPPPPPAYNSYRNW